MSRSKWKLPKEVRAALVDYLAWNLGLSRTEADIRYMMRYPEDITALLGRRRNCGKARFARLEAALDALKERAA